MRVPDQQSDTLLDVLASFFEGVANVTASRKLDIPSQVSKKQLVAMCLATIPLASLSQVLEGYVDSLSSLQQWEATLLASNPSTSRSAAAR